MTAFPAGLKIIAGNAESAAPQSTAITGWKCSGIRPQTLSATPVECAGLSHNVLVIRFPDCWNGEDLNSSDDRSHMAYRVNGRALAAIPSACRGWR